eukprot:scaffold17472_cov53-Attheya_sp.AAC.1
MKGKLGPTFHLKIYASPPQLDCYENHDYYPYMLLYKIIYNYLLHHGSSEHGELMFNMLKEGTLMADEILLDDYEERKDYVGCKWFKLKARSHLAKSCFKIFPF